MTGKQNDGSKNLNWRKQKTKKKNEILTIAYFWSLIHDTILSLTESERRSYIWYTNNGECIKRTNLSHCLSVQLAMIHSDTMNTSNTVPGQMVIKVFKTNL